MTLLRLLFYLLAFVVLASTAMAITRKHLAHAVVNLIVSFLGTAALFYLLGAPLLAALEVIIYAGAIMVLFLFIIMTLGAYDPETAGPDPRAGIVPGVLGLVSLMAMGLLVRAGPFSSAVLTPAMAQPLAFGQYLFQTYWLPVEIVSFLLFVALAGALYLGRHSRTAPGEESAEIETE